jgi:DNA-binding IclR family transcriptional regulator
MVKDMPVKSLKTTFKIIQYLSKHKWVRTSELVSQLELPKSTIHDHLRSLEELGYVIRDSQKYRASTLTLQNGISIRNTHEIYHAARPEIKKLAEKTNENVHLIIKESGLGIVLHSVAGNEDVHLQVYPGTPAKLHSTAPGKAILAHLSQEETERILDHRGLTAITDRTITDKEKLFTELNEIREQGYATDFGEVIEGLQGIAVSIINRECGEIEGSITIYKPIGESPGDFDEETLQLLTRSANIIEINLSAQDPGISE